MKSFLIRDILEPSASKEIKRENIRQSLDHHSDLSAINSSSKAAHNHHNFNHHHNHHHNQLDTATSRLNLNNPLDALFQMTSSTFVDALKRKDRSSDHNQGSSNNSFNSKQASKKKRKSRTAFTNQQIFELERQFRIREYLTPTDRDEIAMTLNLSNAQVITWFQNRRAKRKRDLEEQKRDIETAALISIHNAVVAFNQMKATAMKAMDPIYGSTPANGAITTPDQIEIDVEEDEVEAVEDDDPEDDDTTEINPT